MENHQRSISETMKDFCEGTNKRGFCAKHPLKFRFRRISIRKTVVLRIDLFVYLSDFQALHYSEFLFFKVILRVTVTVCTGRSGSIPDI